MQQSIDIHELPNLKTVKSISKQGFTFKKALFGDKNEIYVLSQSEEGSSIWIYHISDNFWQIIKR